METTGSVYETSLAERYMHSDVIQRDVNKLVAQFKDLLPSMDTYTFDDGTSQQLVKLSGTIPICFKDRKFNIPICIWVLDTYPYTAPIVFMNPTENMKLKTSDKVDPNGRVNVPYLEEWNYPDSELLSLVEVLAIVFSEEPPVFSAGTKSNVTDTGSDKSRAKKCCESIGMRYPDVAATDISNAMSQFRDLRLKQDCFTFNDGSKRQLLKVEGTVATSFKGQMYNTPICIWMLEEFPYTPPKVFLNPTGEMAINRGSGINSDCSVNIPYLQDWKHPESSVLLLIHELVINFSKRPPLSKRSSELHLN